MRPEFTDAELRIIARALEDKLQKDCRMLTSTGKDYTKHPLVLKEREILARISQGLLERMAK